jgi:SET domain-containing protein
MTDNTKFERRETHKYGLGVFALVDIKMGELISSFDGEYYVANSAMSLPNYPPLFAGRHAIQWGMYSWRDGKIDGIARYISHSCDPNCGIRGSFDIVAIRNIGAGEELHWDYAMSENSNFRMDCLCGSPGCRKIVGAFSILFPEQREDFVIHNRGFISNWLVREYSLY